MLFYISLFIWLGFCSLIGRKYRNLIWFNILLLSLINGLRDVSVGIDTYNYYEIWIWISQGSGTFIEPAWYILNQGLQVIGAEYNMLLFLVAVLTFVPIGYVSKKISSNPSLVLLFYFLLVFYLQSFNMMRQDLAMSIVLVGYFYLSKGERIKYYLYTFCAFLFHFSVIFSLPVLLANTKLELTAKRIINLECITFIGSLFLNPSVLGLFMGRYAVYLQNGMRENMVSAYFLGLLMNLFFLFIYKTFQTAYKNSWFMKVYFMGILLMNVTTQLELGARIILYYTIVQIIIFPIYLNHNRFKHKYIPKILIFSYSFFLFLKLLVGDPLEICPYRFYFM